MLLCLAAVAVGWRGRDLPGELIEIGDGFRIPDILRQSAATLIEVGTTNRTKLADYVSVLRPETRAILRVHQSNFRMVGFTESPSTAELAAAAAAHGIPLIDDLGSGQLTDLPSLIDEPTARSSLEAGSALVCFSGDKLLGGPGGGDRRHRRSGGARPPPPAGPCASDRQALAGGAGGNPRAASRPRAGGGADPGAANGLPAAGRGAGARRTAGRADRGVVVATTARIGGGAVPLLELESHACSLEGGERLAARLRCSEPPVVGRVQEGHVLLDCTTLQDSDLPLIAAALAAP